ncbi:MAG TPA: hypothetical protein VJN18_29035, partial [Polyangiaceae bacterium]|nr:hypothetical protein [Polyangiaceae bacterium]
MSRPVGLVDPQTSNLYVEPVRYEAIDKIDLLFMIDNSRSMGDKQKLLAVAVPQLVDRLVVPRCVNRMSGEVRQRASLDEACPAGFGPEFRAVKDIHVAVITSSLGAHGAPTSSCSGGSPVSDRALLIPSVRGGLTSYDGSGFLAWDPEQQLMPGGETDKGRLGQQFGDMVRAAGEDGCGFEASLESWYRFLIDPEPPLEVVIGDDGRSRVMSIDTELLAQRERFLRPDSLVAIVMLTDENDCSVRDEEYGYYLPSGASNMPRASSACERDPNDPCCLPCTLQSAVPEGCPAIDSDPACQRGQQLSEVEAATNLRCFQNKRRFGYDFLYPTSRYIQGLTELQVPRRSDGMLVQNPLFKPAPGAAPRQRDMVYLAGIVGVPWQDIADDASLNGPGLRYRTAAELTEDGRWAMLIGEPERNV